MFMVFHDQNEFHPSRLDLRVARAEEISISGQPGPCIHMSAPAGSWVGGWAIGACDGPTHTRSAESSLPLEAKRHPDPKTSRIRGIE